MTSKEWREWYGSLPSFEAEQEDRLEECIGDLAACEKERDEMRQGRENYLDSAKDAEARALAAEAALKRVRESREKVVRALEAWFPPTLSGHVADRVLAAILEEA